MRIGFLGGGNMASAIAIGAVKAGVINASDIYIFDKDVEKARALCEENGFNICTSQGEAEVKTDLLILAVKPNVAPVVLSGLSNAAKAVVSIVAGLSVQKIKEFAGKEDLRVLRVMPNTPLMAGAGASAFAANYTLTDEEFSEAKRIFSSMGIVETVDEKLFSAVTAISGSGPAYVYLFIEALSQAGVKHGLTKETALKLATQTVLGSARMVEATGKHPAMLKDDVMSPGGTTIEAVATLETYGLRGAVFAAVDACADKADKLV